ncbi:hypothetical protein [uncultured Martelella sp.]|uniref:hypothetical protein n=1 Tax=uncultured Martelella sp. TaxID=392331 RepID=UPI0029C7BE4B|nr:hypothetical protein [uncultured Martelella sp.]
MTREDIIARLANSTADTLVEELERHNLTEDDALTVLAGLCWIVIRIDRDEGAIGEAVLDLSRLILEADQDGSDEPTETGRRLH